MKLFLVTYATGNPPNFFSTAPVLARDSKEAIETLIRYMGTSYTHNHTVKEVNLSEEEAKVLP